MTTGASPGPSTRSIVRRERKAFAGTFRARISPLVLKRASGSVIWDVDDNQFLDFSAGGSVANTGYCHPRVVRAATEELQRLTHGLTPLFPNRAAVQLAERLVKITPGSFEKRVWFGSSGSDAAETVYDLLPAATRRRKIITFFGSHHGFTVGAHLLSGHAASSRYLQSPTVVKVPYPYCYRCPFRKGESCCNYPIDFLEKEVFTNICPPDDAAGILLEPIEGFAGELVPPDDFIPQLRELCDKHGMLLVDDEVKSGMGRTGKMLAIEHVGVKPDAVILGKPLASGMPLSAVVGRRRMMDSQSISHLTSAAGHPVCCAAGLATIEVILNEGLLQNSARLGAYMKRELGGMMERHKLIGDVRGRGLFIGVELVKDRRTKEPARKEASKLAFRAWQRGLIVIVDGTYSSNIEISPPLNIGKSEVVKGLSILEEALTDVERGRVPDSVLDEKSWA